MEHPGDGEDGDGGDLGAADGNGRVALILVAVVDVGLDVVVGRVVVGLLHAARGVAALQDVADLKRGERKRSVVGYPPLAF